jgi:hypothetical protein
MRHWRLDTTLMKNPIGYHQPNVQQETEPEGEIVIPSTPEEVQDQVKLEIVESVLVMMQMARNARNIGITRKSTIAKI